jgi:hypothetical protein
MLRLLPILALALLTSCANLSPPDPELQTYWTIQRGKRDYEQDRLEQIYSKAFTSAFLEGWHGRNYDNPDMVLTSDSDSDATVAYLAGHADGWLAGRVASSENLTEKFEKDKK